MMRSCAYCETTGIVYSITEQRYVPCPICTGNPVREPSPVAPDFYADLAKKHVRELYRFYAFCLACACAFGIAGAFYLLFSLIGAQ